MSITAGIINAHKGSIDVKSEIGKGTEFIIKLPCNGIQDAGCRNRNGEARS